LHKCGSFAADYGRDRENAETAFKPGMQATAPIEKVRDLIDAKMITANHRADDRETDPGEEWQLNLSNVLRLNSVLQAMGFAGDAAQGSG